MTKQDDWEKEFSRIVKTYEKDTDGLFYLDACLYGEIEDFIRQTREQARQEGIEEAVKGLKLKEKTGIPNYQGMNRNPLATGTAGFGYGYNQAVEDLEAKIAELKKKAKLNKIKGR
jgi:hypothetical protein